MQRGFVWKLNKVETLWDSLLRGYPIGSFLFSKMQKLYLMDGQQRATSIFLGYFNPFNENNTVKAWSIKGKLPVVWIDIKPKSLPDDSKYLIRFITLSHPWGYQDNGNRLSMSDRRKALELFRQHPDNKEKGYTYFENTTVFPFDCCCPLPIAFFIESANVDDIITKAEKYLPDYFSTKGQKFNNKKEFLQLLKGDLKENLTEIFEVIKKTDQHTLITSNIIDNNVLNEEHK
ncbi:MAG: DUF262 domain-containing protein [Chitinophagaceae bacterium]